MNQTCLAANQFDAGCEKLLQKAESSLVCYTATYKERLTGAD